MNVLKAIFIIIISVIVLAGFASADELQDLNAQKVRINFNLVKLQGAVELNNVLMIEAAKRAMRLDGEKANLQKQFGETVNAIKKLEVATTEEKLPDKSE